MNAEEFDQFRNAIRALPKIAGASIEGTVISAGERPPDYGVLHVQSVRFEYAAKCLHIRLPIPAPLAGNRILQEEIVRVVAKEIAYHYDPPFDLIDVTVVGGFPAFIAEPRPPRLEPVTKIRPVDA